MCYHAESPKSLYAFATALKDVVVFFIVYAIFLVGWAVAGVKSLTYDPNFKDPVFPLPADPYRNGYDNLEYLTFILYVQGSDSSAPDSKFLALQNYEPNSIYFITFIFANMFLFSLIPGFIIYYKFRQTHSKIILADELRQQQSLLLAFVTLAEQHDNLSMKRTIKFLLFLYKYKIRYVEYITDLCLRLDESNNRSIVNTHLLSKSASLCSSAGCSSKIQ
jgi:hypothetical protein